VGAEVASLGKTLHATRRRRRISLDKAAADTRIRRDYIVAMESDDFSFQAPVYVKGFIANYARALRTDPEPLIRRFEEEVAPPRDEPELLAIQDAAWRDVVRMPSLARPIFLAGGVLTALIAAARLAT
jgi:cytoskeletal protein RodZ